MLTNAQWAVVVFAAVIVFFVVPVGGLFVATIVGLPFVAIVAFFYWWQGRSRRSG